MRTGCRQVRPAENRRAHRRCAVPVLGIAVVTGAAMSVLVASGRIEPAPSSPSVPEENYSWAPVLEWEWAGGDVVPESYAVLTSPVVVDLDGDGLPEVIFVSSAPGSQIGVLRAVSGVDGHEIFTVDDPAYSVNSKAGLAAGDIDGDGRPEIVVQGPNRDYLLAFEHDGGYKWTSSRVWCWGNKAHPALADIDRDGSPEICVCETVLNRDGSTRWDHRPFSSGAHVVLADLDLVDGLELLNGMRARRTDGTIMWQADLTADDSVVADFDDDPYPEVVMFDYGNLYLAEHDGQMKWGPIDISAPDDDYLPTDLQGPPLIADVDGDCEPEIGFGSPYSYTVVETNGRIKWTTPVEGTAYTGSAAADLDGDGAIEVVFQGSHGLMILRGSDGAVLWELYVPEHDNPAWYSIPVIADVDGDGQAEIIATRMDTHPLEPSNARLQVYGDSAWMPTRPVWNQHSYHITNVNDDGTIPRVEPNNWDTHNNYRVNAPRTGARCRRVHLPITLRERDKTARLHADIVLVVDASESMAGTKLAAAKAAMWQFLGLMAWPYNHVAVVDFNEQAQLLRPLTGDRPAVEAALDTIETAPGTRIDAGLRAAVTELGSPRHRDGYVPAIVLLTDGLQEVDPEAAQAIAREARTTGMLFFVIGLGADVDGGYLLELAGSEERYYFAPQSADLTDIYKTIARVIPCRPEDYWGGRCP